MNQFPVKKQTILLDHVQVAHTLSQSNMIQQSNIIKNSLADKI